MAPPKRRTCAQQVVHELLVETDPGYRARRLKVEEDVRKAISSGLAMRTVAKLITIPVVVHVVYRTAAENVSDAQINSQIKQLNLDYRAKNTDVKNVPAAWKSLIVDANIEFALASKDPFAAPLIDPNFLGEDADLESMVAGYKVTQRLMQTPALRALQKQDMFTDNVRTDNDIRAILRERVDTVYHPVGTCKMGVDDSMAVVDPKLKVYGLEGLRVVDASIMPTLVGGNTNAPTIMIGEKAADMIREEIRAN